MFATFVEWLKECLLRKLVADLIRRSYGPHLFTVITEEHLDYFHENNLHTIRERMHDLVDVAADRVAAQGDPLL
jgi:hypothetical protein